MLTCLPVLTEADHLLLGVPNAGDDLLAMIQRDDLRVLPLDASDLLGGVRAYLNRYRSLDLQLADACLAHLGDREGIDTVFSLDRRDFGAVVLQSGVPFQIVP